MRHLRKFDTQTNYNNVKSSLALPNMCLLNDIYEIASAGDEDIVPVEYLSGVSGAYIKTGIIIDSTNWRNIKFEFTGSFVGSSNNKWRVHGIGYSNSTFYLGLSTDNYLSYGKGVTGDTKTTRQLTQAEYTSKHKYVCDYINSKIYFDNESYDMSLSSSPTVNNEFYLFTWNGGSYATNFNEGGKLYNFKFYYNEQIIHDFIPVRVGNVGYMFDCVSKKLFANAGTGNFTLGPDIVPVEYLESTGTQYIDTGVYGHMNHTYEIEFNQTDTNNYRIWGVFGQQSYIGYNMSFTYGSSTWMVRWESTSNGQRNIGLGSINTQKHNIKISNGQIYFDNLDKGITAGHNSNFVINFNLFLFTINPANTTPSANAKVRIYSYKDIDENKKVIRDFIPVKVNNVGYMYDKVSRQLFGNVGSGSFTCAPIDSKIKLTRTK